jgi:hypothetical protein
MFVGILSSRLSLQDALDDGDTRHNALLHPDQLHLFALLIDGPASGLAVTLYNTQPGVSTFMSVCCLVFYSLTCLLFVSLFLSLFFLFSSDFLSLYFCHIVSDNLVPTLSLFLSR